MADIHNNQWDTLIQALFTETGIPVLRDKASRDSVAQDFGRLVCGNSQGVLQPRSAEELSSIISFTNKHAIPITARGLGYSQSGQSLTVDGFTLDLSNLNRVGQVDTELQTIQCEAGAQWQAVVAATMPYKMLPRILPLNIYMTVGGLLSVGGIGSNSKSFGPAIANVVELDVVIGTGQLISCSRTQEPDLFNVMLAGLGRCGVITSATIQLRRIKPYVRTFHLLYDSLESWIADQQVLGWSNSCTHLEGFCWASAKGMYRQSVDGRLFAYWLYGLQVGVEYDGVKPEVQDVLDGLHYWKIVHIDDQQSAQHVVRYDPRFNLMRQSGAWNQSHPWIEYFLPARSLIDILPHVLDNLPLTLGDGHRTVMVASNNIPSFFIMPPGDDIVCFAVLPVGVPVAFREEIINILQSVNQRFLQAGAKRYLSGWLGSVDPTYWQMHYGKQYDDWVTLKHKYDPKGILGSPLLGTAQK